MSQSFPSLLNLKEVSTLCRVSPRTVYGWVRDGRIQPFRINGRLRFDERILSQLLTPPAASSDEALVND
jgi:predicted site-specific integrase-resolvase